MKQSLVELQEEYADHTFYKLVIGSAIMGSVRVRIENDICYINKLCVHPDVQGRGYGAKLMNEVEQLAVCKRFELFTGHRSTKNIEFYNRLGYVMYKEQMINDSLTLIHMYKDHLNLLNK
jgi:GNAT superfamily N-acetyltransferase